MDNRLKNQTADERLSNFKQPIKNEAPCDPSDLHFLLERIHFWVIEMDYNDI